MTKVAINNSICGLSLNLKAFERLLELGNEHAKREEERMNDYVKAAKKALANASDEEIEEGVDTSEGVFFRGDDEDWRKENFTFYIPYDMSRDDSDLVKVVEELGRDAGSQFCRSIVIVEVPDNIDWYVDQYDGGSEFVREHHRTWSYNESTGKTEERWTRED